MRTYGVPEEILTDNGKVFTGRFNRPPVEVLFDRVCRENGITHRLTEPRSPTTTGKVERFHRSLRAEFRTDRVFKNLAIAQAELDAWVDTTTPCGLIRESVWRSRHSASVWRGPHQLRTARSQVVRWWRRLLSVRGSSGWPGVRVPMGWSV